MVKYKKILLKLSGEFFSGGKEAGIDFEVVNEIADQILALKKLKVSVAVVIGGGNIWRFRDNKNSGMRRELSDAMGMLATVMNSVSLQSVLNSKKIDAEVYSAVNVPNLTELFNFRKAEEALAEGKVVICAGGTGNPYFTTDSAAVLRALELGCEVVLKATNVDFVYADDPKKNPKAEILKQIRYDDFLKKDLKVMDLTAISMSKEGNLPVIVFNVSKKGNLLKIIKGERIGTIIQNY